MDTFLLIIAIVLLLVDLDEHHDCHGALPSIRDQNRSISGRVRVAERRMTAMTEKAAQALLEEARRWEPGGPA